MGEGRNDPTVSGFRVTVLLTVQGDSGGEVWDEERPREQGVPRERAQKY